jgi:hypothetical protein
MNLFYQFKFFDISNKWQTLQVNTNLMKEIVFSPDYEHLKQKLHVSFNLLWKEIHLLKIY